MVEREWKDKENHKERQKEGKNGGVPLKADLRVKTVSKHPKYAEVKGMRLLRVSMEREGVHVTL